jgi:hypothetical protein
MIQNLSNLKRFDDRSISRQSKYTKFHVVAFIYLLIAIYLEVPLFFSEKFYVPGFLTVFFIPILILLNWKIIYKRDALFIFKIVIVLLLTALFSPEIGFLGHKFSGVMQTSVAILAGILLVKEMGRLDPDTVRKIFYWFSLILLCGTFLEVIDVLRGVSDSFREVVYGQGGYGVYSNEERDQVLAGFIRPKFFTSEPSLLAIGFFAFSTSWLLLAHCLRNWLHFLVATGLMLYLTASPILLISILNSFCMMYFYKKAGRRLLGRYIVILLGVLLVLGLILIFSSGLFEQLIERIIAAVDGVKTYQISSENLRMVFPYITAVDVLGSSPFFGVGISGKEVIGAFSSLPIDPGHALGNNNLAALFIYLGLLGGGLFLISFYQYLSSFLTSFHLIMLGISVIGLSQMMGAFESPRFWGYVFIFIGVLSVKSRIYRLESMNVSFRYHPKSLE